MSLHFINGFRIDRIVRFALVACMYTLYSVVHHEYTVFTFTHTRGMNRRARAESVARIVLAN